MVVNISSSCCSEKLLNASEQSVIGPPTHLLSPKMTNICLRRAVGGERERGREGEPQEQWHDFRQQRRIHYFVLLGKVISSARGVTIPAKQKREKKGEEKKQVPLKGDMPKTRAQTPLSSPNAVLIIHQYEVVKTAARGEK